MNKELAKTLTTALVQFIGRERPEGTMDCSSGECERVEKAFEANNLDFVEGFMEKKLSRLTEVEKCLVEFYNERTCLTCDKDGVYNRHEFEDLLHTWSSKLLALAKKELLSYADERNPVIEAMAELERTFECNPDKLPLWLKNELTKKHLEGYTLGKENAMRDMRDFLESHFNMQSGTASATLDCNTSATDGEPHKPSFTD